MLLSWMVKNLDDTEMTEEQLTEIYRMVADRRCSRLREIRLVENDIDSISQDLRERAKFNQSVQIIIDEL